jgi:hypothetical protein
MTKYLTEGGLNFFEELSKSINLTITNPLQNLKVEGGEVVEEVRTCLITNDALTEHFVKMGCGHEFNYVPLYKEIKFQKTCKNLEIFKLAFNEIKCPYCRKIQRGLLPFHDTLKSVAPKVYGVNSIIPNVCPTNKPVLTIQMVCPVCPQLLKTGINKGTPCGKHAYTNTGGLCTRHYNLSLKLAAPIVSNQV